MPIKVSGNKDFISEQITKNVLKEISETVLDFLFQDGNFTEIFAETINDFVRDQVDSELECKIDFFEGQTVIYFTYKNSSGLIDSTDSIDIEFSSIPDIRVFADSASAIKEVFNFIDLLISNCNIESDNDEKKETVDEFIAGLETVLNNLKSERLPSDE